MPVLMRMIMISYFINFLVAIKYFAVAHSGNPLIFMFVTIPPSMYFIAGMYIAVCLGDLKVCEKVHRQTHSPRLYVCVCVRISRREEITWASPLSITLEINPLPFFIFAPEVRIFSFHFVILMWTPRKKQPMGQMGAVEIFHLVV